MNVWQDWSRTERRGNYAILTGVLMTMVLGFSAFSVDVSLITMAELQGQATADAASHAALVAFRGQLDTTDGDAAADWIVNYNKVAMGTAVIDAGYPKYGTWDFTTSTFTPGLVNGNANAVDVRLSREGGNTVDLLLAPILGVSTHDVRADSITAGQKRAMFMVVDLSCSMMGNESATSFYAITYLREASLTFLQYFIDHPQEDDLMGLALFAQYGVETGTGYNTLGVVPGARPQGLRITTNGPAYAQKPWVPLGLIEDDAAKMSYGMHGLCYTSLASATCSTAIAAPYRIKTSGTGRIAAYHPNTGIIGSTTNPTPALRQGINELALNPLVDSAHFKAMLFMSDGVPNAGPDPRISATAAWNEDIHIWSILYHNGSFNEQFMKDMVRGLGFYQASPDAADLPIMFETVAKSIPTALVY